MDTNNQESFNQRAANWLGLEIKTWTPIAAVFITAIAFIYMQSARIRALEVRAADLSESNRALLTTLDDLKGRVIRIEANTENIQATLNELKHKEK